MISFTSVNEAARERIDSAKPAVGEEPRLAVAPSATSADPLKSAFAYTVATLLCALFGAVYEVFSHGVYSYFMIYAFAIPLVLGVLANLVIVLARLRPLGKVAANAWNSGVATFTVGCLFQGALEIYGTTSSLAVGYPVAAAVLLVAGIAFHVREALQNGKARNGVSQNAAQHAEETSSTCAVSPAPPTRLVDPTSTASSAHLSRQAPPVPPARLASPEPPARLARPVTSLSAMAATYTNAQAEPGGAL